MGLGSMMTGGNPDEKRGRSEDDFYPTPVDVTMVLARAYLHDLKRGNLRIFEPCAGNGAMSEVLNEETGKLIRSSDLVPRREGVRKSNFLSWTKETLSAQAGGKDVAIITNPPFNLAKPMIEKAIELQPQFFALLLKATFWHASTRQDLWSRFPPSAVHPLTWRPDFMCLGRPTMEVAWFVWQPRGRGHDTIYQPFNRPEDSPLTKSKSSRALKH